MKFLKAGIKIIYLILILIFYLAVVSCSFRKIQDIPMKVNNSPDIIKDGECLHYGVYTAGEKTSDFYMVIRKIINEKGVKLYRVYTLTNEIKSFNQIAGTGTSYYDIDPKLGDVVESVFYNTNANEDSTDNPYASILYGHYHLNLDTGTVEYLSEAKKGKDIIDSKYRIYIKKGFPIIDATSFFYFPTRLMDVKGGGIIYMVSPEFLKEPVPVTFEYLNKQKITTAAGTFSTYKVMVLSGDPFIAKLGESVLKKAAFWVEDSNRRFTVKIQLAFGGQIIELEGITNI